MNLNSVSKAISNDLFLPFPKILATCQVSCLLVLCDLVFFQNCNYIILKILSLLSLLSLIFYL